ncbi:MULTISPECIES: YceI family protein [Mycobacteriaceae]|nr:MULTISPECIES: YceI family protein [Mycobacteriaceae]QPG72053.1 YceI family protein [Mycolicibacterium mucogenicum DSM 44124]SEA49429.1 Polyisoprenoid-binding protein YceI [Mycobacterium sp. 283mftsu]
MNTSDRSHTEAVERTGVWKLDPATADIRFSARGLWGLLSVSGRFRHASGSMTWNQDGTASVLLEVQAASITTGMAMRDRHLRGAEFLDVQAHPVIIFSGHAIGHGETRLVVTGKLVVRDAAMEVQLDVEFEPDASGLVAATTARIDVSAFGVVPRSGIARPNVDLELRGRAHQTSSMP